MSAALDLSLYEVAAESTDALLLRAAPYNPRSITDEEFAALRASLREFGIVEPIVVNLVTGNCVSGHQRVKAALEEGIEALPVHYVELDLNREKLLNLALNRISGDWDEAKLAAVLQQLAAEEASLDLSGFREDEIAKYLAAGEGAGGGGEDAEPRSFPTLADRFLIPPFTVWNTAAGYWRDRKRRWEGLGLASMTGRDGMLIYSTSSQGITVYKAKEAKEAELGRKLSWDEFRELHPELLEPGTSVFDPVVCEIAYRWFCPPGGQVLDPFAGGSVRGVVAAGCDRPYTGIDLSERQVEANLATWDRIRDSSRFSGIEPRWLHGDSRALDAVEGLETDLEADLIFSCPPYGSLERYSDDPADLSTMDYASFRDAYFEIIDAACRRLRPDRFAVWVVGEIRDAAGNYEGFVSDTIAAFQEAGLSFYNEAILCTATTSVPTRVSRMFVPMRKLGRCHQNVLVFLKGDARRATEACGEVSVELPDDLAEKLETEAESITWDPPESIETDSDA